MTMVLRAKPRLVVLYMNDSGSTIEAEMQMINRKVGMALINSNTKLL